MTGSKIVASNNEHLLEMINTFTVSFLPTAFIGKWWANGKAVCPPYTTFYKYNNCKEHHEVNTFISKYQLWDLFPIIRALNDHGACKKGIKGISREAFAEVCTRLNIKGDNGALLDRSVHY
jgi:hypothetical protein